MECNLISYCISIIWLLRLSMHVIIVHHMSRARQWWELWKLSLTCLLMYKIINHGHILILHNSVQRRYLKGIEIFIGLYLLLLLPKGALVKHIDWIILLVIILSLRSIFSSHFRDYLISIPLNSTLSWLLNRTLIIFEKNGIIIDRTRLPSTSVQTTGTPRGEARSTPVYRCMQRSLRPEALHFHIKETLISVFNQLLEITLHLYLRLQLFRHLRVGEERCTHHLVGLIFIIANHYYLVVTERPRL